MLSIIQILNHGVQNLFAGLGCCAAALEGSHWHVSFSTKTSFQRRRALYACSPLSSWDPDIEGQSFFAKGGGGPVSGNSVALSELYQGCLSWSAQRKLLSHHANMTSSFGWGHHRAQSAGLSRCVEGRTPAKLRHSQWLLMPSVREFYWSCFYLEFGIDIGKLTSRISQAFDLLIYTIFSPMSILICLSTSRTFRGVGKNLSLSRSLFQGSRLPVMLFSVLNKALLTKSWFSGIRALWVSNYLP